MRREARDCGAKVGVRVVPKLDDAGVAVEGRLDDPALHAAAASVHETHFAQTCADGGLDVFADNRRDVLRSKRVEIELTLDRNPHRVVSHRS